MWEYVSSSFSVKITNCFSVLHPCSLQSSATAVFMHCTSTNTVYAYYCTYKRYLMYSHVVLTKRRVMNTCCKSLGHHFINFSSYLETVVSYLTLRWFHCIRTHSVRSAFSCNSSSLEAECKLSQCVVHSLLRPTMNCVDHYSSWQTYNGHYQWLYSVSYVQV